MLVGLGEGWRGRVVWERGLRRVWGVMAVMVVVRMVVIDAKEDEERSGVGSGPGPVREIVGEQGPGR
jgi:hypothetical protein